MLAPALGAGPAAAALRFARPRSLMLDNLHTGERLRTIYWADGQYIPEALGRIDWVLRDFRTAETHPIAPALIDLLAGLHRHLATAAPFEVISGYRSAATNAMLAAASDGVAQNSLHMRGMAIDIRVPGRSLVRLRRAALALAAGGVGFYPRSDFVHVDVGRVRRW